MQWSEVHGLIVPYAQQKQMMEQDIRSMYYATHCRCPSCGGSSILTTCVGYAFNDIETAKDDNRADCSCGWSGIVHDLGPVSASIT